MRPKKIKKEKTKAKAKVAVKKKNSSKKVLEKKTKTKRATAKKSPKAPSTPPKRRGRPPKAKTTPVPPEANETPPKRKRGRPRKTEVIPPQPPKKRGRPPKKKTEEAPVKRKRGRPRKNPIEQNDSQPKRKKGRPKKIDAKKSQVKKLELEILEDVEEIEEQKDKGTARNMLEQIMFKLPFVEEPLIGTPKQVQKELDLMAISLQKNPEDHSIFNRIHLYMHGYLINVVLKKFPFIKGYQSVDIYQETLIALKFKAIPNFKRNKGMSFLNFAKMCIRRHLITLLNASKNRKKDQSMNQAISLDAIPMNSDNDSRSTLSEMISDDKCSVDEGIASSEAYEVTKSTLFSVLSDFEKVVLSQYLSSSSYKEISFDISEDGGKEYNTKSIDNALLRIRKKALYLKEHGKLEDIPIFLKKS